MTMAQDVVYAARGIRRRLGLSAAAAVTLAIGIAANAAVFGFARAFVLRPLPFPEAERLVHVWHFDRATGGNERASLPNVLDWRARNASFTDLALFNYSSETIVSAAGPSLVPVGRTSANIFDLLGARPVLGRGFHPGEDGPGRAEVVVLSYGMWQSEYGGRTDVLGQTTALDRRPRTIVGVMGPDFQFPLNITRLWIPHELDPERSPRTARSFQVVGRLREGVSAEEATTDLNRIAAALEREWPEANRDAGVRIVPLQEALNFAYDVIEPMLGLLGLGVSLVLGLACANVAGLLLASAASRQREMAIRTALGASRLRLVRQLLTESLMLAIPGAALGLLLAVPALRAIDSAVPSEIYRVDALTIDLPTALFTAALSVLAAVLAGLAPAVRLTGLPLLTIRNMVSVHQTRATRLFHNALVVVQVALAIVLAGCAALTWQSVVVLRQLDPGFRAADVTTALIVLPRSEYTDPARVRAFQDAVLDQLARAPGVRSTAIVNFLPLNHETNLNEVRVAGHEEPGRSLRALTLHASDRYFETMGIPLLRGRSFDATDAGASDLRVVVSASMAGRFWKDGDALGRTFQVATGPGTYRDASVIGIVGDSAQDDLGRPAPWQLYASTRQASVRYFRVLVRSEAAAAVTQAIRAAVARADSSVAVAEVRSLAAVVNEYLLPQRAITAMLLTLACVALVLAIVGLHGLLAFFVSQHARDIGIRVALGAEPRHVTALVLGRTAILVAIGFAAGAAMVATAGQLLGSFLYGVTTADPATFVSLAALFGGVAFVAAVRPLRRALRIDPADSLRVVL